MENYLAIEQVRFADRLRVDIKVDPSALHSLVPCFLLQPIVENAIRHGIAHCEDEGIVEASARRDGNRLRIAVRDSGARGKSRDAGQRNRLDQYAGTAGVFLSRRHLQWRRDPMKAGGYEVAIDLPYERTG